MGLDGQVVTEVANLLGGMSFINQGDNFGEGCRVGLILAKGVDDHTVVGHALMRGEAKPIRFEILLGIRDVLIWPNQITPVVAMRIALDLPAGL